MLRHSPINLSTYQLINLPQPYFLPYQRAWRFDPSPLRLCVKSRQVGMSFVDAYDSVIKAAQSGGRDVWVMSRDELQARQYIKYCARWAAALGKAARACNKEIFAGGKPISAHAIAFDSGATIYALSSNPDAIVGKTGHVKLDEFALHRDQRGLYAVAKPVTQWGGTLSIISTHRGAHSVFNKLIQDIKHKGNPMGWSLHEIPLQLAVDQGLVERLNQKELARNPHPVGTTSTSSPTLSSTSSPDEQPCFEKNL